MRLWHEKLIPVLSKRHLSGQHRECCALRGNSWGRKHATVDYVFVYPVEYLVEYHRRVMREMEKRGMHPDPAWKNCYYRGQHCEPWDEYTYTDTTPDEFYKPSRTVFPEHNTAYYNECLSNLLDKGWVLPATKHEYMRHYYLGGES